MEVFARLKTTSTCLPVGRLGKGLNTMFYEYCLIELCSIKLNILTKKPNVVVYTLVHVNGHKSGKLQIFLFMVQGKIKFFSKITKYVKKKRLYKYLLTAFIPLTLQSHTLTIYNYGPLKR